MDFVKNQTNEEARKCLEENFKCRSFPEKIGDFSMPNKIYELYTLNRYILDLTNELWSYLFKIIRREEVLDEENVCYDIFDPENCDDINEDYHFFNEELISYQKHYFDQQHHEDYFFLLKKLYYSVLNFLNSPLFSLKNDVERLIIRIHKPHINDYYTEISTEEDVGFLINRFVSIYLELLDDLLDRFNLVYEPSEIKELKQNIKERIEAAKKRKKDYLDKNEFRNTTKATTIILSPTINFLDEFNENFSIIDKESSEVTNNNYTTSKAEIFYKSIHSLDYTSEHLYETSIEINSFDYNESIAQNIDDSLNHNKTDNLFEHHEGENKSVTINDWIIYGSVFLSLFLLLALVFYVIKRYKSGRKKRVKNEFIRFEIIR